MRTIRTQVQLLNQDTMTRNYVITTKGLEKGYRTDFFIKDADDILRHHFNDDFHLYVNVYTERIDGVAHIRGIAVSSDEDTIAWFVKGWVERGILEPVI